MQNKKGREVFLVVALLSVILFLSASGLNALSTGVDTVTVLIELDSQEQASYFEDNYEVMVDYNNGFLLLKVPQTHLNSIQANYNTQLDGERYDIRLWNSGHSFHWRNGLPDIPSPLMANDKPGRMPYIVQFIGPRPSAEWEEELEKAGASIEADLGPYTVLTRMDARTRRTIENMDFVAWIETYHPAFKIQDGLLEREGTIQVLFVPWSYVSFNELESALVEFGVTTGRSDGVGIIGVVDVDNLPGVASLQEVYAISAYSLPQTMDNKANEIHQVQGSWHTSWSGLPERITGRTQVIGMQDTGFDLGRTDAGHPDFFRGPEGDRVIRYTDRTGYSDPDGEDEGDAHGTHIIGVAAGNGWCWRKHIGAPDPDVDTSYHLGEASGVAPEAYLSMDGIKQHRMGLAVYHNHWDDQEADGARVFISAWGSVGSYNSNTVNIDDRQDPDSGLAMAHAYEDIILFAAGNSGPELHTIGAQAQTKNGLGIGASENYRPEWHSADNPTKVASFSSRGGPDFSYGRIKPDVVGVGTAQIAPFGIGEWNYYVRTGQGVPQPGWFQEVDEYDYRIPGPGSDGRADYKYMAGTSVATAQITGMAALVREYYMLIHPDDLRITGIPSNPLVRATLINGAGRMNSIYDYPGYDQGWGIPNLKNSLYPDAPQVNQFAEHQFGATGTWDAETDGGMGLYVQSSDVPLKATLTWIDSSGATLNRRMYMTATNTDTGETYYSGIDNYDAYGWMIEGSDDIDTVNNVQRIEIEDPSPGRWLIQVHCTNTVGTHNNMAVVVSADFGPQETHDVDLQTEHHESIRIAPGGRVNIPVDVRNWGTSSDTIVLDEESPDGFTVTYHDSDSFHLDSGQIARIDIILHADLGLVGNEYEISIIGTSQGDPNAQDILRFDILVVDEKLPRREAITDSEANEEWADVITFTDQDGVHRIFVAYLMDTAQGEAVYVRHSELDPINGRPTGWSTPIQVDDYIVGYPSWPKLLHIRGGTHEDRVVISWTGTHYASASEYYSRAYSSYADITDYDSWSAPVLIDDNYGIRDFNDKRCVYILWQDSGGAGQLTYVFEHLDSTYAGGIDGIGVAYATSGDGGDSWTTQGDIPGAESGGSLYYFFPHGVTDSNEVNWHFFYYRDAASDARMVVAKLQEGTSWTDNINVMGDLSTDGYNWQFPRAAHVDIGVTNTIFVNAIHDHGGSTYDLSMGYIQGDYTVAQPPSHYSFNAQDGVAGNEIEQAGYMQSHILGMTATDDEWVWTAYQEAGTALDALNIDIAGTDDFYFSTQIDKVTRDNYAKLNPQMASLTIGTTSYIYCTYHMNKGGMMDISYDLYLTILHRSWPVISDNEGPETFRPSVKPITIEPGDTIDIIATIDDINTGYSGIAEAEYVITDSAISDPMDVPWPGTPLSLSGSRQTEVASAFHIDVSDLSAGTYHVWVRGRDEYGNWGTEHADYEVLHKYWGPYLWMVLTSPTGGESWQAGSDEYITWTTTAGEGSITHVVLEYSVDGGGSWQHIYTDDDNTGSYLWTIPNEPTTEARIRATVHDDMSYSYSDVSGDFNIIGIPGEAPTNLNVVHYGSPYYDEELLYPEVEILATNVAGQIEYLQFDPTDPDAHNNWYEYTTVDDNELIVEMEAPSGDLDGLQTIGILVRRTERSSRVPELTVELWQDGTLIDTLLSSHEITDTTGQVHHLDFQAEDLVDISGQGLRVRFIAPRTGGPAAQTNVVEYGAVELQANVIAGVGGDENNLVTWDASPDEPYVTGYNVYRSDCHNGPWELIATVTADGGPYSYVDLGRGTADEIIWWYRVYSDRNGFEGNGTAPVPEPGPIYFQIDLISYDESDGWNFVSINLETYDTDIEYILAGIDGCYDRVIFYDAAVDQWMSYVPGREDHFNKLANLDHTMGFWIRMTSDETLTVSGDTPQITADITLYPGWNMVGYPSSTNRIAEDVLPEEVTKIGVFNRYAPYNVEYHYDLSTIAMISGRGYWVFNSGDEAVIWTVEY